MFEKTLIANRGDQAPQGTVAAQPNCTAATGCKGGFAAGETHV